jgi:hypothetical protein
MPVTLPPIAWRACLGEEVASEEELRALLTVYAAALMPAYLGRHPGRQRAQQ